MSGFLFNSPSLAASIQSIYSLSEQITFPANLTTTHTLTLNDALPGYGDCYMLELILTFNNSGTGNHNVEIENSEDRIFINTYAMPAGLTECHIKISGTRGFASDDTQCIFWSTAVTNNETTLVQRVDMNMAVSDSQNIDITITCPVNGSAFITWANAFKIIAP